MSVTVTSQQLWSKTTTWHGHMHRKSVQFIDFRFFCQFEHQQLTKVWSQENCFPTAASGQTYMMCACLFKPCMCTCACVCTCPSLRPQLGKPGGLSHRQRKEQSWPVYLPLIALQLRTDCRGNKGLIVSTRPSQRTSYFLQAADSHCPSS